MNVFTISGRIIAAELKSYDRNGQTNSFLKLKLSVSTGERKKDGEQYAPTMIVGATVWGKYGEALAANAVKGNYAVVSGSLGAPSTYETSDGAVKVDLSIYDASKVDIIPQATTSSSSDSEEEAPKATASKKKAAKARVENFDDDVDDIPF